MFSEIATFDLSVGVDDKGFSLKMLVSPQEDSDLEKMMAEQKNTTGCVRASQGKVPVFVWRHGHSKRACRQILRSQPLSSMVKMLGSQAIDAKAIEKIDEQLVLLQKAVRRYAMSISALPEGSDGLFGAAIVAEVGDAKAFVEGIREIYKAAWKASEDEDFVALKKSIVHKADDETIGERKVDTIKISLSGLAERAEKGKKEVEKIEKVVGKDCVVRFGAVDDKHVAVVYGGGTKRFENVCGAVTSKKDSMSGDQGIIDVSGQLPSPRSGEGFIAVDNIIQTLKAGAKLMGEDDEFPFEAPTLNAPVAWAVSLQDKSVSRVDIVVPMKLVKAVKEAAEKFQASAKNDNFDEDDEDKGTSDEDNGGAAKKGGVKKPGKPGKDKPAGKPKKPAPPKDDSNE
jgi:hypothetical protein